ncbi:MAG TPA: L-seryl-tRNA(Sec) selenium transferase [Acetobacteraceae bacterium]|jgi:L-seryl-tRNA(Ser) seleniumtransferase|nr:L-seryl-tRNA(Sec) selenium transferase [Acetobacteraceae bacterium]
MERPPSVDAVLRAPAGALAVARFGRQSATLAVRQAIDAVRPALRDGATAPAPAALAETAFAALERRDAPSLRPVLNLTGTVLHTNLGRALWAQAAVEAATATMVAPAALEYDLTNGGRGERDDHVRDLLRELTGAEAALVVNNNAAAVLLGLAVLASGRQTIVSRGELIEIGGAFRMPAIMASAGTQLVEVGTTNRTHPRDYEQAIGTDTALLLKVHTSNYRIEGFTAEVAPRDLATLAHAHGLPMMDDLGSGTLVALDRWGLPRERTVAEAVRDGGDLVTFSGDKLLGGPQAGFIVGRADLVARCAKHPLKRALRLDKVRLAALEATLRLYRDPDRLPERLPTLRLLTRKAEDIHALAEQVAQPLAVWAGPDWRVEVIVCRSQIGSGALPVDTLESAGVALHPVTGSGSALTALAARLRTLSPPIIGALRDGALRLDLRCLEDAAPLLAALRAP